MQKGAAIWDLFQTVIPSSHARKNKKGESGMRCIEMLCLLGRRLAVKPDPIRDTMDAAKKKTMYVQGPTMQYPKSEKEQLVSPRDPRLW